MKSNTAAFMLDGFIHPALPAACSPARTWKNAVAPLNFVFRRQLFTYRCTRCAKTYLTPVTFMLLYERLF